MSECDTWAEVKAAGARGFANCVLRGDQGINSEGTEYGVHTGRFLGGGLSW